MDPSTSAISLDVASAGDLPSTIALLRSISSLASSTLSSISSLLPTSLSSCPFDPRHRMPSSSLFLHYLRCPSPIPISSLRYRTSLTPLSDPPPFRQPLPSSPSDLCFSLEDHLDPFSSPSDLLYRDCPAVVCFPQPQDAPNSFSLPLLLAAQCSNFLPGGDEIAEDDSEYQIKVLPSEVWTSQSEAESWGDRPSSCSYVLARVLACLDRLQDVGMKEWILCNSPRYGVVIDVEMGEHVIVLLKVCLKAVRKEAMRNLKSFSVGEEMLDGGDLAFDCPGLCGSVMWFGSQLSILYGEDRGRCFAVDMIRESILRVGSSGLIVAVERCEEEAGGGKEGPSRSFCLEPVSVSQIAAAIAALHERSLLESRIRDLRCAPMRSRPQILSEHCYTSLKANEERGKRANYRPLLEHDGLIWQQSHGEEQGRPKTREELLAEERDYKRRRMSYRGKKVKRTPNQVLHDIIEDHMEEIRKAGGIGCHVKGSTSTSSLHMKSSSGIVGTVDMQKAKDASFEPYRKDSYINDNRLLWEDNNPTYPTLTNETCNSCVTGIAGNMENTPSKLRHENTKKRGHMDEKGEYHVSSSSLISRSTRSSQERYARHERRDSKSHRSEDSKSYRSEDDRRKSRFSSSSKEDRHSSDEYRSSRGRYTEYDSKSLSHKSLSRGNFKERYDPPSPYTPSHGSFGDRYDPSGSSDMHEDGYTHKKSEYHKVNQMVGTDSGLS